MRYWLILTCCSLIAAPVHAQPATSPPVDANVDYAGFQRLTKKVAVQRLSRLVEWEEFDRMADEPGTLLLDARSAEAYAAGHIDGAVNLPLTDFTPQSLAALIGDRNRRILIYCNNNFRNDRPPVLMKSRPLALNIQTFINLVGYGYPNVYELKSSIDLADPKIGWVKGTAAEQGASARRQLGTTSATR